MSRASQLTLHGSRAATSRIVTSLMTLLAAAALLLPSAAHAWSLQGDLNGQNNQFANTSAGALSQDMAATGTFIRLGFVPKKELALELSWHTFRTSATTLQVLQAESSTDLVTLGASYIYHVRPWFRPFVRGAAGVGTTLAAFTQGTRAEGRVTMPAIAAAAGFELLVAPGSIVRGHDFTVGFLLEFGWLHIFHGDLELKVDRTTTPSTDPVAINAGGLGWSAFTTRFGLVVRI